MPESLKRKDTAGSREFWEFVEAAAQEVQEWPAWKRGEEDESLVWEAEGEGQSDSDDDAISAASAR